MDILSAIKREERKLEKQLGKLQRQLNGVRAAESFGRFDKQGTQEGKEARVVRRCESEDFEGTKKTVGEGQSQE